MSGSLRYPLRGADEGDGALGVPGVGAPRGGDVAHAAKTKQPNYQVASRRPCRPRGSGTRANASNKLSFRLAAVMGDLTSAATEPLPNTSSWPRIRITQWPWTPGM